MYWSLVKNTSKSFAAFFFLLNDTHFSFTSNFEYIVKFLIKKPCFGEVFHFCIDMIALI